MNSRSYFIALGLLLLLMSAVWVSAQNTEADDAQFLMDSTAADLASPNPDVAAKAEKQLIGLGEAAMPAVQKIMRENGSAQVRRLGQEVLSASESRFNMAPTLVTLKLDSVPPQKAFDELSRIGGVRAEGQWDFWHQLQQGMPRRISVDFDKKAFAQALCETCQKAHIQIQQGNWQAGFTINPDYGNARRAYPTFMSGPVLFYLASITRSSSVDLGSQEEGDDLSIELHALADPKLPLARIYTNVVVTEATGDSGESLIDPDNNGPTDSANWSTNVTFCVQENIPLKFRTGLNKTIKSLKGAARFAVLSEPTKIEITDLTPGKSVTSGAWTARLDRLSANGNGYTAHIVADNSRLSDGEGGPFSGAVVMSQLYDATGLPYIVESGGGNFQAHHAEYDINFHSGADSDKPHAGPPAKLVLTLSAATRIVRLPFEFTNLPIPSPKY